MTIYYVDYEGSAGTGDGTSFANRAGRVRDCSFAGSGSRMEVGDVCRIKKTPDPTVLGTGRVDHAPTYPQYQGNYQSYSTVTYSTTEGQTSVNLPMSTGYKTGDRIMIYDNSTSTPVSDGTEGKNISGIYSITLDTSTNGKGFLDGFTAANTNSESGNYRAIALTAETIQLSGTQPWKVLSSLDGGRPNWTVPTAASGVTTTDHNIYWTDWTSGEATRWTHPAGSDQIQVTSNSVNGLKAYVPLGSATDLSAYQQISFICKFEQGDQNVNSNFSIRLCTDTAGVNSVHTIPIQRRGASNKGFHPQVKNFGTALNTSIQSIAIYQDAAITTTHKFQICNICACKASSEPDSVTHMSAIGLNTTADPVWYPVLNLCENGIISLVNFPMASRGGWYSGYYKASGCFFSADNSSATIYKREYIIPEWITSNISVATSQGGNFDELTWVNPTYDDTNAPLSPSAAGGLVSGGWDTTNMSTQEGHTFIRGNGRLKCYYSGNTNTNIEKVHGMSWYKFIDSHGGGIWLDDVGGVDGYEGIYNINSMHNARKLDIKYAIGSYTSSSSTPAVYIGGQTWHASNINPNAPVTNFNIGYANGAFQNNSYAVRFGSVVGIKFNKINTLFSGKQFDFNQNCNGITIEEIITGGAYNTFACKFEDGGNNNLINTTIKKLIVEGNRAHTFTVNNCGSNNVIEDFESKDAEESGWGTYQYHGNSGTDDQFYRFGANWESGQIYVANGSEISIKGGSINCLLYVAKNSTVKTTNLVLTNTSAQSPSLQTGARVLQKNWNNQAGSIKNYIGGSSNQINPETTTRHTNSGYAWKMTGAWNANLKLDIMKVVVNSGSLVTIKVWVYRENGSITYTGGSGMAPTLTIKANPDVGLNNDVIVRNSFANNDHNTYYQAWEELSASFTPNAAGVVQVELFRNNTMGNTGYGIIWDDLSVSQV